MKLSDPTTWVIPVESIEINDPTWGLIEIQRWSQFHFYHSADHPMEIILIQSQGKGLSQKKSKEKREKRSRLKLGLWTKKKYICVNFTQM